MVLWRREHESPFTDDEAVIGVVHAVAFAAEDGSFDCHRVRDGGDDSCFAALRGARAQRRASAP